MALLDQVEKQPCPRCQGSGGNVGERCEGCGGRGWRDPLWPEWFEPNVDLELMRCRSCGHEWADIDAAIVMFDQPCPSCHAIDTEPTHDHEGNLMQVGWLA